VGIARIALGTLVGKASGTGMVAAAGSWMAGVSLGSAATWSAGTVVSVGRCMSVGISDR